MNNHINYVELAAKDLVATQAFFEQVFDWQFESYGPDYIAFANSGLDGGFFRADVSSKQAQSGALVVLYSDELEAVQSKVEQAGGEISKAIFEFPGGRRFHFIEPSGNEFAVWSK
ncbi:VOC family protein [Pseudoalteromonas piscicida]|uniref:VOC family protein n=1 Tax=Pseudoalteromonas piscicida TaxID=43662 RepID=UPI0027399C7A|nr:VOC family protein [Pseudoalteromonas piscicida]MDP4489252.1 VOC family protein [Pseudoalteromonas piscicida]